MDLPTRTPGSSSTTLRRRCRGNRTTILTAGLLHVTLLVVCNLNWNWHAVVLLFDVQSLSTKQDTFVRCIPDRKLRHHGTIASPHVPV